MATIRFSQCHEGFSQDEQSRKAAELPMIPRMKRYEELLNTYPDGTFSTMDENFLLVAQWMKRSGRLKTLTFVSVCHCRRFVSEFAEHKIETDESGDMLDDPHHGFFPQRLDYLR